MTSPSIKEPNSTKVSVSQIWMLTTAVLVVAAFLGVWFLFDGKHNTNWALLLFLSTLTGYFFNDMLLKKIPRSIYRGFLWGAALSVLLIGGEILYQNNLHPKVWDFSCFYLDGQVIASGRDLYNPESYKRTFEEIELPTELQIGKSYHDQVVNIGFKYFPPAINYFMPLAGLSYTQAQLVWTGMNLFALLGVIILVFKVFFVGKGKAGWLYSIILVLGFRPILSTLFMGQFHLWGLAWVLLAWLQLKKPLAGIWLSFAAFTKPQLLLLGGQMLAGLKFRQITAFVITALALFLMTFANIGFDKLFGFIESFQRAGAGLPPNVYIESINKSLLANLLRTGDFDFSYNPIFYPPFLILGGLIGLSSLVACWKVRERDPYLSYGILLVMSLIVYPGTLFPYGVYVLPVLISLMVSSPVKGFNNWIWLAILLLWTILHVKLQFWSLILMWTGLMVLAFFPGLMERQIYQRVIERA